MAKNFLEVFPTLNIAESLKELLGLAQVEKVTTTRDRSSIRIYLKSARLIHKQNIYDLERGIRDQLFPDKQVAIKIQEKYRLSDQYTPKKLLDVYKDSLLLELKTTASSSTPCSARPGLPLRRRISWSSPWRTPW